jgi:hypothetical protein
MSVYCGSCGAENIDRAKFCGSCGAKIEQVAGTEKTSKTEQVSGTEKSSKTEQVLDTNKPAKKKNVLPILGAVALVVVVALLLGHLFQGGTETVAQSATANVAGTVYAKVPEDLLETVQSVSESTAEKSGTCGDGLQWYYQDGVLIITGEGEMNGFYKEPAPWYDIRADICYAVVEDGVRNVSRNAFSDLTSLNNVFLADSVTSIGQSAFSNCSNLTEITIPEGVSSIGEAAFSHCTALDGIEIPARVREIQNETFSYCTSLGYVHFRGVVTSIGDQAFYQCGLLELILPEGLTYIGSHAFDSPNLAMLCIPCSVTEFADGALTSGYGIMYPGTREMWNAIENSDDYIVGKSNAASNYKNKTVLDTIFYLTWPT